MQLRRFALAALMGAAAVLWLHPARGHADQCGFVLNCSTSATAPQVTTPPATVPPPPAPVASTPAKPAAGVDSAGAAQLLDLVNQARTQAGVGPLIMRDDIVSIAVGHSQDMARQQLLFHNDNYFTSGVRSSLGAGALGENVDMNYNIPAVHAAFMASPHHLANIVDSRFTAVGIGVVIDSSGAYWVTEDFAQIRSLRAAPAVARTPPGPSAPPRPRPAGAVPRAAVAAPVPPTTAATEVTVPAPGSSLGGSIAALTAPPQDDSLVLRHTGGAGHLIPGLAVAVLLAVAAGAMLTPGFSWRRAL
jgi:uncharacterized protein YkwD